MNAPATFLVLFLLALSCLPSDASGEGPHLEIASVSGKLEMDRESPVLIELCNGAMSNASAAAKEPYALDVVGKGANASAVTAELLSQEDGIEVLSGPQMVGTLAPGMNRSIRFSVLARGAQRGVYPLQLSLRFSQLRQATATGEGSLPDIVFLYEDLKQELPVQVEVVQGSRLDLEETKGDATPGEESDLELVLANRGDEPALDLRVGVDPLPPFDRVQSLSGLLQIEPGGSAEAKLRVHADGNASTGYYPLPCLVSYRDGENRSEELAVLIQVKKGSPFGWLLLPAAGLLLLVLGYRRSKSFSPRRRRRRS